MCPANDHNNPSSYGSSAVSPLSVSPLLTSSSMTNVATIRQNFENIKSAPRELWVIFILKFFSSYSYFAFSLILTLYLSESFHLNDIQAGFTFGIYGVMATISGVICGWFIDLLGVRKCLILGSFLGVISRFIIAFTTSKTLALSLLFTVLPFSDSLGIPIMTIGVKRYTNQSNRTFAYSLFYSIMNIAALVVGPIVDSCRSYFEDGIYVYNFYISSLRIIIITTVISSLFLFIISILYVRDVEVDSHGNISTFIIQSSPTNSDNSNIINNVILILHDRKFWKLFTITLLLIGIKMVFAHVSATMPKYLIREFGDDAPFGLIFSINPLLIIFLVPTVGIFTKNIKSFPMILYGSFLAAASPLCICIQQSYSMVVLFSVVLSIGEAVYSPRTYEYSMLMSPRGKEGLYTSLAAAPLFSANLFSGIISGWLLQAYMPVDGSVQHGKMIWAIIGCISLTSPILMFIFRNFLKEEDDDNPQVYERKYSNETEIVDGDEEEHAQLALRSG